MIVKNKNPKIHKKEDASIVSFLQYYSSKLKKNLFYSAIKENNQIGTPDYYIEPINTLIEVKEIHDRASNQKQAQWGDIATNLQKAVDNGELLSSVKGTYLVNTPELFKLHKFNEASKIILEAVVKNDKKVNVFGADFEINKVSDQGKMVVFGSMSGAGFIDPPNIVYTNIKDKLITANKQLDNPPANVKPTKRIVLLVNKYYFPLWNWDLFKAISFAYQDLRIYQNIDEIWYQLKTKDKGFTHQLLYRKSFFDQFEKSRFTSTNAENYELFANWFSALSELGEEKKNRLFIALQQLLKDKRPDKVFLNSQTRQEMVRLGLWLAEKERFDDVVWLVEQFITDDDPPKPENYKGDAKFNYHSQILNNEDVNTIVTVLGHLAWTVQKLAVRKDYIVKSFGFTQKLLKHKNYYAVLQGLVPLIEIAARRQWLEEYDKENSTREYQKFKSLAFDLLEKYSQYKSFGDPLTHLFYYYKDLDTDQAVKVLKKLEKSREAAALFVYFGIFRERHFKGKVTFDQKQLREILESIILEKHSEYFDLKGSIAWNFWRILEDTPTEFDTIKPYLDLFMSLPYNKRYYSSLERIIEEWIERNPDICIRWFETMIEKVNEYVKGDEAIARNTWIDSEIVIQYIARNKPILLIDLVGKLVSLWKLGAFVGDPKDIFEVYKFVQNPKTKKQIKDKFTAWYKEMRELNPKLHEVTWD